MKPLPNVGSRRLDVQRLAHLRHARDLMDRSYAEPLDVDALAREAGYSRYHFVRSFRAAYGETPGRPPTHTGMFRPTLWDRGGIPRRLGNWFSLTQRAAPPTG